MEDTSQIALPAAVALRDPHALEQALKKADKISSADLVKELLAVETSNWNEFRKGKPITQNTLAKMLANYRIYPGTKRFGPSPQDTLKGYEMKDFDNTWNRYLPDGIPQSIKRSQ